MGECWVPEKEGFLRIPMHEINDTGWLVGVLVQDDTYLGVECCPSQGGGGEEGSDELRRSC